MGIEWDLKDMIMDVPKNGHQKNAEDTVLPGGPGLALLLVQSRLSSAFDFDLGISRAPKRYEKGSSETNSGFDQHT